MIAEAGSWAAAGRSGLPWSVIENQRARREAARYAFVRQDPRAPIADTAADAEIADKAEQRADYVRGLIADLGPCMDSGQMLEWLRARVAEIGGGEIRIPPGVSSVLASSISRATCPAWWRRALRRAVVRAREARGVRFGEVCAERRQPYVTNDTANRMRARRERNRAMLEARQLESESGQVLTLAELVATSTANPAIRRGELMTRISGCEKLAGALGHRGVFLTLTAPSRFHATGGKNSRYVDATPRDAHEWLCSAWARARARLARIGVTFYGFRVSEPHRDGCPHWHALLWCEPGQLWRMVLNLRRWWLRDSGDEPGARAHRCKAMLMQPGGAAGYVAKYVAKNIDDAGAVGRDGHKDDEYDTGRQVPLIDGTAARVQAWASCWGIRQFQAVGQPPVTIWRELRRVDAQNQAGATMRLRDAFAAVNREGERRACWARYVLAQGGLMMGRDYAIAIGRERVERPGRYELREVLRPVGVYDKTTPATVHASKRQEWRPRGVWAAGEREARAAVHPWTRVNNCTQRGGKLQSWRDEIDQKQPGAGALKVETCETSPPSRPSWSPVMPRWDFLRH